MYNTQITQFCKSSAISPVSLLLVHMTEPLQDSSRVSHQILSTKYLLSESCTVDPEKETSWFLRFQPAGDHSSTHPSRHWQCGRTTGHSEGWTQIHFRQVPGPSYCGPFSCGCGNLYSAQRLAGQDPLFSVSNFLSQIHVYITDVV